jgi:hypothetical protein
MLRHCLEADKEHGANQRQYAHTFHYPETICVAEAFWTLPKRYRDGVILHEIGHLLAGVEASEKAANDAVEERTGARIEYVDSKYGPNLERAGGDVRPRLSFDSVSGRGSAGLPVAVANPTMEQFKARRRDIERTYQKERKLYGERAAAGRRDYILARLEREIAAARESYEMPLFDPRENVTDRALRYRANELPPEGPRVCCYCGSTRFVEIDHVDGFEENTDPDNLVWACRSCNTLKGIVFRNGGRGRLTAQYNPTKTGGAANVGEWVQAVGAIIPRKGEKYAGYNYGLSSDMSTSTAVEMIRATPQWKRQEFAGQLRKHRRSRREEVPF